MGEGWNATAQLPKGMDGMGEVVGPDHLLIREARGEGTLEAAKYELSISISDGSPVMRDKDTGHWFLLSWLDIMVLAHRRTRGVSRKQRKIEALEAMRQLTEEERREVMAELPGPPIGS